MTLCCNLNHTVKYSIHQSLQSSIRPVGKIHSVDLCEYVCIGHCYFFISPTLLPLGNCPSLTLWDNDGVFIFPATGWANVPDIKMPHSPGHNKWSNPGLLELLKGHYLGFGEKKGRFY